MKLLSILFTLILLAGCGGGKSECKLGDTPGQQD